MAGNNSKGFMSDAINEVKKEIQRDKEQIKQAVIDEVRSSIGNMTIDVGDIKVTPKMKLIVDEVDLAQFIKMDKGKLQKNIKEYYDAAMNGSDKSSKKFIASMKVALKRGINLGDEISTEDLNYFEDFYKGFANKVNNELSRIDFSNLIPKSIDKSFDSTVGIFKSIIKEAQKFGSIEKYLSGISNGSIKATDEMNNLLEAVKILSNGKYKFSGLETGSRHLDGIISDEYTIIARSSEYEEKTNALIPKLQEAEAAGVQLGTIIGTVKDDANDLFYEIQKTQQGKPINSENLEYLQATDEQILKLKKDIEILQRVGLFVDVGAGAENILYGKNGFSFIDLAVPKDLDKIPDYLTNSISGITDALNESLPFDYSTMKVDENISKQFDSFADTFANISEPIVSSTKKIDDNLGEFGDEVKNTTNQIDENITNLKSKIGEYNEIISGMKRPAFHVGDISNDYTYKSESLPSILSKGGKFQNIIGSGLYVTEDLEEALQLVNEGYGGGKLHVVDLKDIENQMVRINSQEAHSKYVEQLGQISSYVFKKAKIGNEDYYRQSEGIEDLEQLYDSGREFFEKYNITITQLDGFIQEAILYAKNHFSDWSSHNISTLFQQKLLGALGVDVGNSFDLDNQGIGSLIFDKYDLREIITIDPKDIKQSVKDEITERFFARKANNAWNNKEDIDYRLDDYKDEAIIDEQKYIKVKKEITDIYNNAIKLQQLDLSSLIPEMNKNNLSTTDTTTNINTKTEALEQEKQKVKEVDEAVEKLTEDMRELSNVQLPAVIPLSDKQAEAREAFNKDIRPNDINALYNDGEAGKNAELITYEAKAFDVVSNNAEEAAESKDEFARANREVLQSILTSLAAINSEGNGFANLNKIINSLSKNDKMDKLVKNLERIRDVLNIDISDNSFINAIRDIASQGTDLNDIATVLKASASQINKAKEAVNNKKGTTSSNNELDNVEKATKLYKDLYATQEKQSKIKEGTNFIKYSDLENDITNIINKIKELQLTEEEEAKAKANADKERKSAANAAAESERKLVETREKNIQAAEQEQVQATKQATSMMKNGKLMAEYGDKVRDVLSRIKSINTSVNPEDAVSELKKLRLELTNIQSAAEEAGKSGKSFGQMLVQRFKSLGAYLATFVQFYDIVRYTRQAFSTIMDLDTQLVDLRKTTSMTTSELNQFYIASSDVAKELGVTTSEIISQASAWSRLGYSTKEASTEMAKLSSKFASVSPGMTTENATDYLVSTMQAYGIAVDDVERKIMDNVNRIGNTFATTNAEIGEMLTRSSAAMNAANNSLEETIALESAAKLHWLNVQQCA